MHTQRCCVCVRLSNEKTPPTITRATTEAAHIVFHNQLKVHENTIGRSIMWKWHIVSIFIFADTLSGAQCWTVWCGVTGLCKSITGQTSWQALGIQCNKYRASLLSLSHCEHVERLDCYLMLLTVFRWFWSLKLWCGWVFAAVNTGDVCDDSSDLLWSLTAFLLFV